MPEPFAFLQQFLQQGAKTTVMRPLTWLVGLLLASTVSAATAKVDHWLIISLAVATGVAVVAYIAAFAFFAFTDSDALRSEKFTIQKMALERGFVGDDVAGYIPIARPLPTVEVANAPPHNALQTGETREVANVKSSEQQESDK